MSNFSFKRTALRRSALARAAAVIMSLLTTAQARPAPADLHPQARFAAQQTRQTTITRTEDNGTEHTDIRVRYNDGSHSVEVRAQGAVEFTDDDSDVKSMARDGFLSVEERRGGTWRRFEVSPGADAQPERAYYVGGRPHALDPEARAWLGEILPDVIRNTAIGARARVRRIYRQRGAGGVLDEISLIKSDGAKRVYFRELLRVDGLDAATLRRAARQAGREISSDGEKAALLIESADLFLGNRSAAAEFFDAVSSISSDGERRHVLSTVLGRSPDEDDILRSLRSARGISSDGEKAALLVEHLDVFLGHPATLPLMFDVTDTISSDGEHARVLSAMLRRRDLGRESLTRLLRSAERISSDGEKANVLLAAVRAYATDARALSAIADAAKTISTDGERARVLSAIARQGQRP